MSDNFPSDEEKALFREAMRQVKPLQKGEKSGVVSTPLESQAKGKSCEDPVKSRELSGLDKSSEFRSKANVYLSDYCPEEVQSDTLLSYCSPNLPSKRLSELKNGKIPWQARLDLHGRKAQEAKHLLIQFIDLQIRLGHRCLLIIHGKGNYQGTAPILKNLVNRWLPQFPQVLAFHSALPRDGSSGALYVLLKRLR